VLETDAEIHVGVTLSRSLPGEPKSLSLDLNNNNFSHETDRFNPTEPFSVSVRLPNDFKSPLAVTVSEPGKGTRQLKVERMEDRVVIAIEPFVIYRLIQIKEQK
jgi:hypothetical protein